MEHTSDLDLAQKASSGNSAACGELVHAHYQRVYQFLMRSTLNADDAADLTQETFAAAWPALARYRGEASLAVWLHRIAYCKLMDRFRRQRRRAVESQFSGEADLSSGENDSASAALRTEESKALHTALSQLGAKDRDVLTVRYLQGLTVKEAAIVLNQPTGTIKWRTRQALLRLKGILTRETPTCAQNKNT